jgi:hypothetical protein
MARDEIDMLRQRSEDTGRDRLNRVDEPQAEQASNRTALGATTGVENCAGVRGLTPREIDEARKMAGFAAEKDMKARSYLNEVIERKERECMRTIAQLQELRQKLDQMYLCDVEAVLELYHRLPTLY